MNKKKKKRILFISLIFIFSLGFISVILLTFKNNIVFFYSPSEIFEQNIPENKVIRIGGLVKKGSIKYIQNTSDSKGIYNGAIFTLTDNNKEIEVEFIGILPDLFRENQGTIAKGILIKDTSDNNKTKFMATELLTKHDEKYMPPEVKRAIDNGKQEKK